MFLACSTLLVGLAGCCSTDPVDLTDPDPDVRRETLACIGEAAVDHPNDQDAARAARGAALRAIDPGVEEHTGVRATGHRILERMRVADTAPAVATRLTGGADQDPSAVVRAAAAAALGAIGGEEALEALRQALLRDPSSDVRAAAARELGDLDDASRPTTEALVEALRDEAGVVRLNARRSLRHIHGADLGLDPRTWRLWLEARARRRAAAPEDDAPAGRTDDFGQDDDEPVDEPTEMDDVPADEDPADAPEPAEAPASEGESQGAPATPDGGPQ